MPSVDVSLNDTMCDSRMAAWLGVQLVRQVLDEAFAIANAAQESGQPWQYLSMLRRLQPYKPSESTEEQKSIEVSKVDGNMEDRDQESTVVTSTPQKNKDETAKPKPETPFIGQGDEDSDLAYLKEHGIVHQTTVPYSPAQNGVSERANRTIMEKVRCMLKDAGLDERFWAEAVQTAVYIKNRTPTKAVLGATPEEKWTGKKHIEDHINSTSMYINHLFDMSDVEKVIICDNDINIQSNIARQDILPQAMMKIMDSYVNAAFNIAFGQDPQVPKDVAGQEVSPETARAAEQSCLTFISEALGGNISKDMGFYIGDIDNDNPSSDEENVVQVLEEVLEEEEDGVIPEIVVEEIIDERSGIRDVIIIEEVATESKGEPEENKIVPEDISIIVLDEPLEEEVVVIEESVEDNFQKNVVTEYGNMYLTLNRDYEQCSEEYQPVLQDPEAMVMQEIELMTAHTSEESLSSKPILEKEEEHKELQATSNVSALSGKSKNSLSSIASRFRSQSARFLSCLRGWWRRKTPGKRRDKRNSKHGSISGLCPLSPDARRRAASLLDQRDLYSPRPARSVGWKFNTVNEAVINSSRYKRYTLDDKPDESGDSL